MKLRPTKNKIRLESIQDPADDVVKKAQENVKNRADEAIKLIADNRDNIETLIVSMSIPLGDDKVEYKNIQVSAGEANRFVQHLMKLETQLELARREMIDRISAHENKS